MHHSPVARGFEIHAAVYEAGKLRSVRQGGPAGNSGVQYHSGSAPQAIAGFGSLRTSQHRGHIGILQRVEAEKVFNKFRRHIRRAVKTIGVVGKKSRKGRVGGHKQCAAAGTLQHLYIGGVHA